MQDEHDAPFKWNILFFFLFLFIWLQLKAIKKQNLNGEGMESSFSSR